MREGNLNTNALAGRELTKRDVILQRYSLTSRCCNGLSFTCCSACAITQLPLNVLWLPIAFLGMAHDKLKEDYKNAYPSPPPQNLKRNECDCYENYGCWALFCNIFCCYSENYTPVFNSASARAHCFPIENSNEQNNPLIFFFSPVKQAHLAYQQACPPTPEIVI